MVMYSFIFTVQSFGFVLLSSPLYNHERSLVMSRDFTLVQFGALLISHTLNNHENAGVFVVGHLVEGPQLSLPIKGDWRHLQVVLLLIPELSLVNISIVSSITTTITTIQNKTCEEIVVRRCHFETALARIDFGLRN